MSNTALGFPFGFFTNDNLPQDAKYFNRTTKLPYTNVAEATDSVLMPPGIRHKGLTVNIAGVEYWWRDGIADNQLIVKTIGTSDITLQKAYTNSTDGGIILDATRNDIKIKAISGLTKSMSFIDSINIERIYFTSEGTKRISANNDGFLVDSGSNIKGNNLNIKDIYSIGNAVFDSGKGIQSYQSPNSNYFKGITGSKWESDMKIEYAADYSSSYTNRTLIDKAYADATYLSTGSAYTLPTATVSTLGGVKIGAGVSAAGDGTISVSTNYQAPLSGTGIVKFTGTSPSYISGTLSQYIAGDGTLVTFPSLTGFVPFTGSITNVVLGGQLTTPQINFASSYINGNGEVINLYSIGGANPTHAFFDKGLRFYNGNAYADIKSNNITGTWSIQVPNASGTLALTTDIPSIANSMATNRLLGRYSAGTGIMQEISIGSGLTLTGAGVLNNTATATQLGYYGAWQDMFTQTAASSNVGYPFIFRTIDLENQVRVVTNGTNLTRITFDNTGIYNLQFSAQIQNADNAQHDVSIWLRKNGTDVVGSSGLISVPARKAAGAGNEGHGVFGWNYLLSVVAGEYYEIVWSTTNAANVTIQYYAGANPPPSTASVLATVTQQSGIMAGTGITGLGKSGNIQTGSVQTLAVGTSGTDFDIVSSGNTQTFNLPIASATNTGKLSATDWSEFKAKLSIQAGVTTGVAISFLTDRVYGSIATPETGNITANVTDGQIGVTNIIIHNSGTAPTFGSQFKKLSGSGNYLLANINYIFCTYITSTEVIYAINQRT